MMNSVNVSYSTFWSLVSSKGLIAQYVDTGSLYVVFATEGSITWETDIVKDGTANQTDFETNHKPFINLACGETKSGTGTITILNGVVIAPIQGSSTVVFNVTGTWNATLGVQATLDGTNWFNVTGYVPTSQATTSSFSTNQPVIVNCAGFYQVQLIATAFTSGTINIAWSSSLGANASLTYSTSAQTFFVWAQLKDGVGNNITSTPNGSGQSLDIGFSRRATYTAASASFTPASTPTDVFTIVGSATKTVKIWRIEVSSNQTSTGTNNWFLIKRSTANSGGTLTTLTSVPLDSTASAATATVSNYTVNPTALGNAVGTVLMQRIIAPASTSLLINTIPLFDASEWVYQQPITLRGTAQNLAINFAGVALPTGLSVNFSIIWTEE